MASGKGGVGKSTVAANLAIRLGQLGHRTGLLDADIYGPSIPMMFGINETTTGRGEPACSPSSATASRVMSLGFILEVDTPVIWRGPMVVRAIEQMLGDVEWGELDYLIIDLPPGTGDAQLTLAQKVPLISGAVIVTTPQDIALIDARKGLAMFEKVNVPVIGIIENMSTFVCPSCGESTAISSNMVAVGAHRGAVEVVPYLGSVPLDAAIVLGGDAGEPIVVAQGGWALMPIPSRDWRHAVGGRGGASLSSRRCPSSDLRLTMLCARSLMPTSEGPAVPAEELVEQLNSKLCLPEGCDRPGSDG